MPSLNSLCQVSWEKGGALTKAPSLNWKGEIITKPSEEVQKQLTDTLLTNYRTKPDSSFQYPGPELTPDILLSLLK